MKFINHFPCKHKLQTHVNNPRGGGGGEGAAEWKIYLKIYITTGA